MNIGQCDFDMFEVTIAKLYSARVEDTREWIERIVTDQPTDKEVREAWSQYRMALVYCPMNAHPALSTEAGMQLAALVAVERAMHNRDADASYYELACRVLAQYGPTDRAFITIRLLYTTMIAPKAHVTVHGHYPVNEKAYCLAYANDSITALVDAH